MGMVFVNPVLFHLVKHAHIDGARVDGAEGECFKMQEVAVRRLFLFNGHKNVFDANAKLTFYLTAWVGSHRHACLKGNECAGAHVFTNLMRTFMYAESGAYTVSCAV